MANLCEESYSRPKRKCISLDSVQVPRADSYENRTRVTAVKGRCLNRLTNEPYYIKWTLWDSNPGPTGYEPVALTN